MVVARAGCEVVVVLRVEEVDELRVTVVVRDAPDCSTACCR